MDLERINSKKDSKMKKPAFIIPLIIIITIGLGISGYYFIVHYPSKKLLDKAKAYEGIGDYKKAIEQYINYLIKKPDDLTTKFNLASVFLKDNQSDRAIELLKIVHADATKNKTDELIKKSKTLLVKNYYQEAKKLREDAQKAIEAKDYKLARNNYEKESFCVLEKSKLNTLGENKESKDKSKDILEYVFKCSDYFSNIANIAYTYWLEGDYNKAKEVVSDNPYKAYSIDCGDYVNKRFSEFASLLNDLGSTAFDNKDFKTARECWQEALANCEKAYAEDVKDRIPLLMYNIAITYLNQENYWKLKELLTQLQKDYPEYEPEKVKRIINLSGNWGFSKLADDNFKKGNKAFDKENYSQAREHFRASIKYAKKSGVKDNDSFLASCRFNIAITYWNKKNWKRAKQHFLVLQKKHPNYKKDDVQDYISKAVRFEKY